MMNEEDEHDVDDDDEDTVFSFEVPKFPSGHDATTPFTDLQFAQAGGACKS